MNRADLAVAILERLDGSYEIYPIVKAKTLRDTFGISGGTLRVLINELRCQGWPICSCSRGYYLTWNPAEISKTIKSLQGRQAMMQQAIDGLSKLTYLPMITNYRLIVPQVEEGGDK